MFRAHIKHEKANDFTENFKLCRFLECLSLTFINLLTCEVPSQRSLINVLKMDHVFYPLALYSSRSIGHQ